MICEGSHGQICRHGQMLHHGIAVEIHVARHEAQAAQTVQTLHRHNQLAAQRLRVRTNHE